MGFSANMVTQAQQGATQYSQGSSSGALEVLSGLLGAASELTKGKSAAIEAQQQASTARLNARLAGASASMAESEGKIQQAEAARAAYKSQGRTSAALAESGLLGSATGASVIREREGEAEREQGRIAQLARLNAAQYKMEQSNYLTQAKGFEAQTSTTPNWLSAAGRVLGGVASGYDYARESGSWFKRTKLGSK